MQLETFFPYRLARLADVVSHSISQVYGERFSLCRDEWRILAAAGEAEEMPTREVAAHTSLDKVSLSRAASKLEDRGLIHRTEAPDDRRIKILHLTETGRATLDEVTRIVNEREAYLLEGLDAQERAALEGVLGKLAARAELLVDPRYKHKCRPDCVGDCEKGHASPAPLAGPLIDQSPVELAAMT